MSIRRSAVRLTLGCALLTSLLLLPACSSDAVTPPDMAAPVADPPEEPPPPRVAVFNEIHYAPVDKTTRQEFVEIASLSEAALDLSGWRITGGITF